MGSLTWTCPNCNRRVPTRVDECHCGTRREAAELLAAAAPAGRRPDGSALPSGSGMRNLGWDLKALAAGLVLVTVGGLGWLAFAPYRPDPIYPVLGYTDNPQHAPTPPPPAWPPRRPQPPPRFKLPWWR